MVKYLHYCRMSIKKKGYNITLGIFIGLIAGVIIGIIMPEWANMGIECGFHYLYGGIKNDDFPTCIHKFSYGDHWNWGYCQNR